MSRFLIGMFIIIIIVLIYYIEDIRKKITDAHQTADKLVKLLAIKTDDPQKWTKYYDIETYRYYDYLLNIIPNNQNILEVGSGGGIFYTKYKDILTKRNNKYTCIDIDEQSIEYSKQNCDYVNFFVKDICTYTETDFEKYDLLLLVQSYIQIHNIEDVFKKYFKSNPNGCIMMINTIFPSTICGIASIYKNHIIPILFNNTCIKGKALTLKNIDDLGLYLNRSISNINICYSLSGFSEYLTIIR